MFKQCRYFLPDICINVESIEEIVFIKQIVLLSSKDIHLVINQYRRMEDGSTRYLSYGNKNTGLTLDGERENTFSI